MLLWGRLPPALDWALADMVPFGPAAYTAGLPRPVAPRTAEGEGAAWKILT